MYCCVQRTFKKQYCIIYSEIVSLVKKTFGFLIPKFLSMSHKPLQPVAINTETSSPTPLPSCCHTEFYTVPREFHAFTTAWLCEFMALYLVFFPPETPLHTQNGISSVNLFSLSHIINLLAIKQ